MKKILLIVALTTLSSLSFGLEDFYKSADDFFKTYVIDGKVNYKAVKMNERVINDLVDHLGTSAYSEEEEKAYLINAYNIFVIYQVIENYGEIKQPTDLIDFFTGKNLVLNNELTSLDYIENEILRKKYNDPRIHFALVCGAKGCPPITNFAYTPDKLDEQLEAQTKAGLNRDGFVYEENGTNYISQIFEWFQGDFGKNKHDVIEYINKYRDEPLPTNNKVRYYPYDWNLNETNAPIQKKMNQFAFSTIAPKQDSIVNNNSDSNIESVPTVTEKEIPNDKDESETNLQTFTAGSLLKYKQMDFTTFNTIYTETQSNWLGNDFNGYRGTFTTHLLQYTVGITKNRRLNLGVDLNFSGSARNSNEDFAGTFRAFSFQNNDSTRFGLSAVGIRLRAQPFQAVKDFTIQSTFMVPTIKHPEGFTDPAGENSLGWANWDRYTWWNQFFYTKTFSKFQLFAEIDLWFRFKKNANQIGHVDIPLNVFFSYFPTNKITLYAMTQHVPRLTNNISPQDPTINDWVVPMNYTASGLGFKYNFTPQLNIELLYTNFWRGVNSGLGNTFNLGLKFLTK